jgi:ribonuclease Z
MFHLTFLGTGGTVPSAARGLPSLLVEHERTRFLIDCGEGTLRQLRAAHLGVRRLDKLLLTHGHLDHVLGLAGVAGTLELWEAAEGIAIYGGRDALEAARRLLDAAVWPDGQPGLTVDYRPVQAGCIYRRDGVSITAFPVTHHETDSFGYRVEEEAHRPLDEARLDALGVPAGPERHRLAAGATVTLADGRPLTRAEVEGPPEAGASVAIIGDAQRVDDLVDAVRGADLLVIEASFRTADIANARTKGHLTVADATWLARAAGVRRLALNHQSDRYDPAEVLAEARDGFADTVIPADLDRIEVRATAAPPGSG